MITYRSKSFIYTDHKPPKDETAINAKLLEQACYVRKLMAGVYTYLPLGFRVLQKINQIIREEMDAIGGQEILMPALNPKENWQKTGRWQNFDVLFKLSDKDKREYALGPTHEEVIVPLAKKYISSYKDLPFYLYQIQDKFRDELRVKSGLLRGREFIMKDLYSFHADEQDLEKYYQKVVDAYFRIFSRCGIKEKTYLTLASGGTFSRYSHEFQMISLGGEDTIYVCQKCKLAVNQEIKSETPECPECHSKDFKEEKAIEVGNIFKLYTKYSDPFKLKFKDKKGRDKTVVMGCYGIGLGRLMGAIMETHHDQDGIIWPSSVAPYQIYLISLDNKSVKELLSQLDKNGFEVLYDDRDVSAGIKFKDADLIGLPVRLITSAKTGRQFELKYRGEKQAKLLTKEQLMKELKQLFK